MREALGPLAQGSELGRQPLGTPTHILCRSSRPSSVGRRRRRRPGLGALAAGLPAMAESVERLQLRIEELERELARERSRRALRGGGGGGGRARIEKISPEVVDSNPYR